MRETTTMLLMRWRGLTLRSNSWLEDLLIPALLIVLANLHTLRIFSVLRPPVEVK